MFKKRKKNEETLSETLGNFINQDRIKSKFHEVGISKIWRELMGDMIANYTSSIKVTGTKLIIVVTSAPLKHELAYNKENLINMINEKIGYEFISEIIIR